MGLEKGVIIFEPLFLFLATLPRPILSRVILRIKILINFLDLQIYEQI